MAIDAKKDLYSQKVNKALIHIQDHIGGQLSLECLAKVACLSPFHFHRIFSAYVGETLHHYVYRLRMDRAAFKLRYSKDTITNIALALGYETSAAFAKAFKQYFGVSPSQYRVQPTKNDSLQDKVAGDIFLSPEPAVDLPADIRTLPEQRLLFIRKTGHYQEAAQQAWSALMPLAYQHTLVDEQTQFIGITHDDPQITAAGKIRYDACLSLRKSLKTTGDLGVQTLAGGKYAVFLHAGPYYTMRETYQHIYGGWLPGSGHQLRDLPSFALYLTPHNAVDSAQSRTEIHIPI
ncbi:MAG: GyrI-like domain-containing protein [Gallionellaceae bacterium]|nr:GyrI-like domain-containing protein [Gallionellaceae bacterium]